MENKIAWILLASKNRTNKKINELAKTFEKKKSSVRLDSEEAISVMNDVEKAFSKGYGLVTYIDEEYPKELKNIAYPPPYLYTRGDKSLLKYPLKVTIAGSRDASVYGMNIANTFANELASENVCIVSGGARGIDTAAIKGAMRVTNKVIVVIGTGIDNDYPKENAELFKKVCENGGLIVSEFPMGMDPLSQNFPVRNRIMTALGDSVVIVEAAQRSGALISASHASEQGKTVFAVPGNIDSHNSVGTNELLRDGALFALSSKDILCELMDREFEKYRQAKNYFPEEESKDNNIEVEKNENIEHLSPFESAVVNALKSGKATYEEIQEFTLMETNKLTSVLTIMEIKGIIKLAFRNKYKLND